MYGRRYNKLLTVILVIIIVAIIGLLGYLAFNYYKDKNTTSGASEYVDAFEQTIASEIPTVTTTTGEVNTNEIVTNTTSDESNTTSKTTKKTTYQGFEVVGTIEIPKTNVKYPVLSKLSSKALNTAVVAIYPGSPVLNSVGNVVIAGHNYRNGTFFSNNKKLSNGDKIYIKDLEGNKVTYIIYNIFETTDTDTSFYNRDTDGKREITLSTCTDDSKARLIIEAAEE